MRIYLLWIGILLSSTLIAQNTSEKSRTQLGLIIGNILEAKTGKPLAFASIQLKDLSDTSRRLSTVADKNGAFEFNRLSLGYYRLTVNMVGFAQMNIDSIYLRPERYDFNLGDIKLNDAASTLNEVIVYAEKPLIENKDDKITYNVGESALSGGASTAELLKNMPLVNNDPNGKILLKGKEPRILIDDKPTELNAQQLQDLLESLPGSSIEKIEIMTNPPPQYATETGGVINIVTKKGKIGWVGRTTLSMGTRGEGNLAANASYRTQPFSINITAGLGGSILTGNSYSKRENIYRDSTNYFNTTGSFENKNLRPNLRVQTDFEMNKRNQLNFTYQGNLNYFDNESVNTFVNINRNKEVYRNSTRTNGSEGEGYGHNASLSYTHKAKNPAEFIRVILNVNANKNNNDRAFFQEFLNPDFSATGIDSTQSQFFDNLNRSASIRADYNKPLRKKGANFSSGIFYNRSFFHNTLNTSFLRKSDGVFIPNDILSNDFEFLQNIFTARAGFGLPFEKGWRLNFGLQAEHTEMGFAFLKGNGSNVNNGYWNVLPNISLRKEFNKSLNSTFIYRATIRRPGIGELNPNVDYSDPYNLRFGNPYLRPTLSDNFDWNLSWIKGKYYINTSIGYNRLKDVFNSIRNLVGDGKTEVSWLNIADRREYEASIWGGYTFSKQLRVNTSMGYTMNKYSETEKKLYRYRDGNSFYSSLNYTFTPSNVLTFEGNIRFSNFANPQGRSRSNVNMNLGVQHRFFDRRLILSFNAIDPFTPQRFTNYTYGANFNLESFNSSNTRNFRIAVSYQLNKVVQKSKLSEKDKKAALQKIKAVR
ncbi:MAG: TonB-dependent receptor [Sediminibacterium sp. Gen4]|uniref:outer membrane beta-barrel protein n=1 Tax=unclassified Sediminibacterium TaxID=2635961 RepID=UPI0015BD7785|nr:MULTISPECIES: outer membrane beta-barrel protein [unclassified Sediminibacterium]MBW0162513.1 TonB-dependent receptor [Sediminibacterium sp.]MBW0163822.1 TonB-dependent receptor [Sediminibacterium sp.]NWK66616.1 TonB-dependent receptor [Sediminibacterium sp. Gen4]